MPSTINATSTSSGLISSADSSGVLALQTSGTTAVTVTTAQLVGVGTTSPSAKLHVTQSGNPIAQFTRSDSGTGLIIASDSDGPYFRPETPSAIRFNNSANTVENMRVDSSGRSIFGATSFLGSRNSQVGININGRDDALFIQNYGSGIGFGISMRPSSGASGGNGDCINFTNTSFTTVGSITTTASTTSYNITSDYRLKENVLPMTNALATVSALKPCTYTWKADGSNGQGFIAHELQSVVPDAVTGKKDATETYKDENGIEQTRIKPQGIDTSFLVATLTAAIQEQQALITQLQADVAALKAQP